MRGLRSRRGAVPAGLAESSHAAPEPLGWDGVGAIAILFVAAAHARSWLPDSSVSVFAMRVVWVVIYLAVGTTLVRRFGTRWLTWTLRRQPALCVLLTLTVASSLWSLAPWLTLLKATSLLGTTTIGVFIGIALRPEKILRVLHWAFIVLIVPGLVVALVSHASVAVGTPAPRWQGIMDNKNSFGAVAGFATIFFLVGTLARRIQPIRGIALSGLSLFALERAHSRTSFVALGVSLIAAAYLATGWATGATVRRAALALVLGVSILPFLIAPTAAPGVDDDLLHGRAQLWAGTLAILGERPLTGYGYAAVWGRYGETFLPHIPATASPGGRNAHNGIADIASELGIPGAIAACCYLFGALVHGARLVERAPSAFAFFAFAFLVGMTVLSFSEAPLLRIHSIFWILFVAFTVAVQRTLAGGVDGSGSPELPG